MDFWDRISTATSAFWNTWTTFGRGRDTQLIPLDVLLWDTYLQRLRRYELFTAFVTNSVYSEIYRYAEARKEHNHLYKHIRSLYNPAARLVDLYAAYIYGGAIDYDHLASGAIPVSTDNQALIPALSQVLRWSQFGELKSLYVRNGAQYGDAPMKIVDDPARQTVRIELLDPRKLKDVTFDAVGNVKAAVIEYMRADPVDIRTLIPGAAGVHPLEYTPQTYLYTEIIDRPTSVEDDGTLPGNPDVRFRTFRNGQPFAFMTDDDGQKVSEWTMPYGFVPLVVPGHSPTSFHWHRNAFDALIPLIDAANNSASLLSHQIGKATNPLWAMVGVTGGSIDLGGDKPDQVPFVKLPLGGDAKPLVFPLDIPGALAHLQELIAEMERVSPELALQSLRQTVRTPTAPGITAIYSDALARVQEAAGNYDNGLIRALQMAVSIAGYHQYEGFGSFSLDSYDQGDLQFVIKDRVIIPDDLTKQNKLTALQGLGTLSPGLQRLGLKVMEYSDTDIDEVINADAAQQEAQTRAAVRGVMDKVFNDSQNGENPNANAAQGTSANAQPAGVTGAVPGG